MNSFEGDGKLELNTTNCQSIKGALKDAREKNHWLESKIDFLQKQNDEAIHEYEQLRNEYKDGMNHIDRIESEYEGLLQRFDDITHKFESLHSMYKDCLLYTSPSPRDS